MCWDTLAAASAAAKCQSTVDMYTKGKQCSKICISFCVQFTWRLEFCFQDSVWCSFSSLQCLMAKAIKEAQSAGPRVGVRIW